jgi:hypothetical protein
MGRPKLDLAERIRRSTDVRGPNECWPWAGKLDSKGYGVIYIFVSNHVHPRGREVRAHRVACELAHGPIPVGAHVAHLCHNRVCVNPAHLQAVAQAENIRQTVEAGNHSYMSMGGEMNPSSKLTRRQVDYILRSKEPTKDLAERFGVSRTQIKNVRAGKVWNKGDTITVLHGPPRS